MRKNCTSTHAVLIVFYISDLLKYHSLRLTFDIQPDVQFNKCKNLVGNSAPNMLTLVVFAIFTLLRWHDHWPGQIFSEKEADLEVPYKGPLLVNFEALLYFSCSQYVYFINSHDISPLISVFVFLLWVTRQILLKVDQRVASLASLAAVRRPASPTSLQIGVKVQWRNIVQLFLGQTLFHSISFEFWGHSLFLWMFSEALQCAWTRR